MKRTWWSLALVLSVLILFRADIALGGDYAERLLPPAAQKMLRQYFASYDQKDFRPIYRDMTTSSFKVAGSFDSFQEKMSQVFSRYGQVKATDIESMFIMSAFNADMEGRTFARLQVAVQVQHAKGKMEHRFSLINQRPQDPWEIAGYVLLSDEVEGPLLNQGGGLFLDDKPKAAPDYPWDEELPSGFGLFPAKPDRIFQVNYERALGIAVDILQDSGFAVFSFDKYRGAVSSHATRHEPGKASCGVTISLRRVPPGGVKIHVASLCGSCDTINEPVVAFGPASGSLSSTKPGSFGEFYRERYMGAGTVCMDYVDPSLNQKIIDLIGQAIEKVRNAS